MRWWGRLFGRVDKRRNKFIYVDRKLHQHEVPRCLTCGHSALLHDGWPERGDACWVDDGCKRLEF